MKYTGENWQEDILDRDYLESFLLIDVIAGKLYKDIQSSTERRNKLLEIPEMQRLKNICIKECEVIDKLKESNQGKKHE